MPLKNKAFKAINNKFSDFKARSKVRVKNFKLKMIGVCYV